jgi:hypothetical protein
MMTTLVMMTATAAGISAVNFAVTATSAGPSSAAADIANEAVVTEAVIAPTATVVAAGVLEPLPDTPLPVINEKAILAQAAPAPAYVAPAQAYTAAPAAPTASHEGEREHSDDGEADD